MNGNRNSGKRENAEEYVGGVRKRELEERGVGGKQPWRKRWKTIGGRGSREGGGDEERWLKKGMTNGRGKRNISARLHVELRPSERVSTKNVQPAAEKTPFLSAKNEKFRISFVSDGQISPRCARIM